MEEATRTYTKTELSGNKSNSQYSFLLEREVQDFKIRKPRQNQKNEPQIETNYMDVDSTIQHENKFLTANSKVKPCMGPTVSLLTETSQAKLRGYDSPRQVKINKSFPKQLSAA